jgi:hypothetical protein
MQIHGWCGVLVLTTGCLMAGNYHTAKTLDKGSSQFGLTFSATRFQRTVTDSNGKQSTDSIAIPNLLPELTYHIGLGPDSEAGGRVSLGALGAEFDVKYRFLHEGNLHLAIAPAVSYQAFVIIEGVGGRLPAILTYELADNLDLNLAAFASLSSWTAITGGDTGSDFDRFNGKLTSTGGAIGFDLHGEVMSIRPAVEVTRYVAEFGNNNAFEPFTTVNFLVHIAWTGGRTKRQLDRIENKLDRALPGPGTPYPPPAPYPQQPYPQQPYPQQPYPPPPPPPPSSPPPLYPSPQP